MKRSYSTTQKANLPIQHKGEGDKIERRAVSVRQAATYLIGIDPGTKTGFAVWQRNVKKLILRTYSIHEAMDDVKRLIEMFGTKTMFVTVEDARQAVHGRQMDKHKAQGAGSIKRDCSIWEDFLTDLGIAFEMKRPNKNLTKMNADLFADMTGYKERCSSHARDAALLVFGY